jgi:hypothetical protein
MGMSAVALTDPRAHTLYSLSEELVAYLETVEMTEEGTPERQGCEAAIATYMEQLPAKVDGVSWMLVHLEGQVSSAAAEVKRLQARKQTFERAVARLEAYCVRVIEKLPKPKKGQPKLEGEVNTLSIRPSEGAIVTDESMVPPDYKTACVEMPARDWGLIVNLHPQVLGKITKQDLKVRLAEVKKALQAGETVPGADLEFRNNLVRK